MSEIKMYDPLLNALFVKIPPSGSNWPMDQRLLWLSACESVFNLLYGPADRIVFSLEEQPSPAANVKTVEAKTETVAPKPTVDPDLVKAIAELESAPQKAPAPLAGEPQEIPVSKPVNSAPKNPRPEGIPTSIQMAIEAIEALGPASAAQIRDWLRKKYWEKMPDSWTACLWNFVADGRLSRSGINFVVAKSQHDVLAKPSQVLPATPSKVPMPPVKPTGGQKPVAAAKPIVFSHNGAIAELASPREYIIAAKLLAAMGKGHVAEAYLAESITGRNTEDGRKAVKDIALGMNDRLFNVGLKVEHYPGFGLIMKDV